MLILGAKEKPSIGDAPAFERAVAPLLPSLQQYCRFVARNRWDADDLMQDTLEKAFRRFVRTGGAPINQAYVRRIAFNAWIDRARRAREDARPAEWRGWETLARAADDGGTDDVRAAVERLVAALTPKQRTALLLCEAFGLSLQETGERLGLPAGAVKSLLHRARAALRRADGEPADALDGGVVDAYVHALRLGLTQAVVALGAEPAAAAPHATAARGALAARRAGRASRAGLAGFAATSDGACAAVLPAPGAAALRVRSFRAGDAIAA